MRQPVEELWDLGLRSAFGACGPDDETLTVLGRLSMGPNRVHLRDLGGDRPPLELACREIDLRAGRIGRLELVSEIARGGVGVILQARDPDLGRDIAVKVLLEEHASKDSYVRRFVEEAQVGGQLQHPGIVPVYELGLDQSMRPYFTMKLVRGLSLAAMLEERENVNPRTLLEAFHHVCQTMAYVHARGVVHRDLKPSNVMVGAFGEVQVMDWGLVKVLGERGGHSAAALEEGRVTSNGSGDHSVVGTVLGTPAYMAPEQARGELDLVDERADVFALGGILLQILTGRAPYVGRDCLVLAREAHLDDALAALGDPVVDRAFADLARSCLEADRTRRPRSARDVVAALDAIMEQREEERQRAQVATAEALLRARSERKTRRLTMAISALLFIVVGLVALGWSWAHQQGEVHLRRVQDRIAEAWRHAADADLGQALAAITAAEVLVEERSVPEDVLSSIAEARSQLEGEQRSANLRCDRIELATRPFDSMNTVDTDYPNALQRYGLDVSRLPKTAAEVPSTLGADDRLLVARMFEDLAYRASSHHPGAWRSYLAAADRCDPEPMHVKLRAIVARRDRTAFQELLAVTRAGEPPAADLVLLARAAIWFDESSDAIELLETHYDRLRSDLLIVHELALAHACSEARDFDRIRYYASLATALHPDPNWRFQPPLRFPDGPGRREPMGRRGPGGPIDRKR